MECKDWMIYTFLIVFAVIQIIASAAIPWFKEYPRVLTSMNLVVSLCALLFVFCTLGWKKQREQIVLSDKLRLSAYVIVFCARIALMASAIVAHPLPNVDLSFVPFLLELIGNIIRVRASHPPKEYCLYLLLLVFLTLIQGELSISLAFLLNTRQITIPILNWVLAIISLGIVGLSLQRKLINDDETVARDRMRMWAYLVIFVIRSGILAYDALADYYGHLIYNFDLSCIPYIFEFFGIVADSRDDGAPVVRQDPRDVL